MVKQSAYLGARSELTDASCEKLMEYPLPRVLLIGFLI